MLNKNQYYKLQDGFFIAFEDLSRPHTLEDWLLEFSDKNNFKELIDEIEKKIKTFNIRETSYKKYVFQSDEFPILAGVLNKIFSENNKKLKDWDIDNERQFAADQFKKIATSYYDNHMKGAKHPLAYYLLSGNSNQPISLVIDNQRYFLAEITNLFIEFTAGKLGAEKFLESVKATSKTLSQKKAVARKKMIYAAVVIAVIVIVGGGLLSKFMKGKVAHLRSRHKESKATKVRKSSKK